MMVYFGVAAGLIILGLLMVFMKGGIEQHMLQRIVYWLGIVFIIVGIILVLAKIIVWAAAQLSAALGV